MERRNFLLFDVKGPTWPLTIICVITAGIGGWLITSPTHNSPIKELPTQASVTGSQPPIPEQPTLPASTIATLAGRAARGFVSTMNESGATGTRIAVDNCYTRAAELRTYKSAAYCVMLDGLYFTREQHMSKRLDYELNEFSTAAATRQRMIDALALANAKSIDVDKQAKAWILLAQRDAAAHACHLFEVRWRPAAHTLQRIGCKGNLDEATLQSTLDEYLDHAMREISSDNSLGEGETSASVEGAGATTEAPVSDSESDCLRFGFGATPEAYVLCRLRLEAVRGQLEIDRQQYDQQLRMHEQRMRVYNEVVVAERERWRNEALLRFGAGMAASQSPRFADGLAAGTAAFLEMPRLPPQPPPPTPPLPVQDYTVTMPNGSQVTCGYADGAVKCR